MLNIEKPLLKVFLLNHLQEIFCDRFKLSNQQESKTEIREGYAVDSKILQLVIQEMVTTGEYTLEGIAYYTQIPLDVVLDAACGINKQLAITPWLRIVKLYIQMKPEILSTLTNRLATLLTNNNQAKIVALLSET